MPFYNDPSKKTFRRSLRQNQSEAEKLVWSRLRNRQIADHKFLRQYSAGPFILDFYCASKRLCIELDGDQHGENQAIVYDKKRDEYLRGLNITVLRFSNHDVMGNLEAVLDKILESLQGE